MIKDSVYNDRCLLILLPANDAAKNYCNQIESSSTCKIQFKSDHVETGLVYSFVKSKLLSRMKTYENCQSNDKNKCDYDIRNNNNASMLSSNVVDSLGNLTIEKRTNKLISRDLMKQRRVKFNKNSISSPSMTALNIPHAFNLWYGHKKKENCQ